MSKHLFLLIITLSFLGRTYAVGSVVSLNNSSYQVPGILTLPDTAAAKTTYPAVIMLHGTGSHKNEVGNLYQTLAGQLAEQGIASLRIDFAGSGDSKVSALTYSLESAVTDGQAALQFLNRHPAIDGQRLGVIGFSQGALIAQLLVLAEPTLQTMVVWSPAVGNGSKSMKKFFDAHYGQAKREGRAVINYDWRPPLEVNITWFEQLLAQRSLSDMKKYTGQLLAIAGSNDTVLPWQHVNTLIDAAGSRKATAVVLKDADHIFNVFDPQAPQSAELLRITSEWLTSHLQGHANKKR